MLNGKLEYRSSEISKENANINSDGAMGKMLLIGSNYAKNYNLSQVIPSSITEAHNKGQIYIHDLDFYDIGTTTCTQIDIKKLFSKPFSTGYGSIRVPNSIHTYAMLAAIVLQSNQNEQHGGQSIPNFDYALSDGVKKSYMKNLVNKIKECCELLNERCDNIIPPDISLVKFDETDWDLIKNVPLQKNLKLIHMALRETEDQTFQAMEALVHNLNSMHSRAGSQVPFTSINFGTDTSRAGRLVSKCFLQSLSRGLGGGETPLFPISVFKVKTGINFNPSDPNYDLYRLSLAVSAKRLFPNFVFLDAPFNLQYYKYGQPETEVASMGCRTRVIGSVFSESDGVVYGRGNLSFTTINLPRIALEVRSMEANDAPKLFINILKERMRLAADQLLHRFGIQCSKQVANFPFLLGQGIWFSSDVTNDVREMLKHGTLSIGFIGLAECLKVFFPNLPYVNPTVQEAGVSIISTMRNECDSLSLKHHLNFTLLATPAEGLSGKLVKKDKVEFGVIQGITDKIYYTNSFHVPVYDKVDILTKIRVEAPYHALCNAGAITYIEVDGDITRNLDAFDRIVRLMHQYNIGYGAINHPIDRCMGCLYEGVINTDYCPKCFCNSIERIRRITGYLVGSLSSWNEAKRAEEMDRVKHSL